MADQDSDPLFSDERERRLFKADLLEEIQKEALAWVRRSLWLLLLLVAVLGWLGPSTLIKSTIHDSLRSTLSDAGKEIAKADVAAEQAREAAFAAEKLVSAAETELADLRDSVAQLSEQVDAEIRELKERARVDSESSRRISAELLAALNDRIDRLEAAAQTIDPPPEQATKRVQGLVENAKYRVLMRSGSVGGKSLLVTADQQLTEKGFRPELFDPDQDLATLDAAIVLAHPDDADAASEIIRLLEGIEIEASIAPVKLDLDGDQTYRSFWVRKGESIQVLLP